MDQVMLGIREMMRRNKDSEREVSQAAGLARTTLRKILHAEFTPLQPLLKVMHHLGQSLLLASFPSDHTPMNSTVAISFKIAQDGEDSWKIHLMNMVDEFRASLDMRLILLPPDPVVSPQVRALIASTVIYLCEEAFVSPPSWARQTPALENPWFVSGIESLKASALLESPVSFRSKNIFVLENFLQRA